MPLVASISGIRGVFGDGLDAVTIVRFASAFGSWCRRRARALDLESTVVVGRDGRQTGDLCSRLVAAALQSTGCRVLDAGQSATPTLALGLLKTGAVGGVMVSASHNPAEWNALKLFNERGEYLSSDQGREVLAMAEGEPFSETFDRIGSYEQVDFFPNHLERILALPYLDRERIAARRFKIVVDAINSVGGVVLPGLLRTLGVPEESLICLNCIPDGRFAHEPEPLPANLTEICEVVRREGADLGLAVDPDVDRLALIADGGAFIGEELTQVVAADFLLRHKPGPFVTNLSSSRAIEDMAARYGQTVFRSAVGEANVVDRMREVGAVLGGEGNGGVILPDVHYGRDALTGTALVLQLLAETGSSLSELVSTYPRYVISKNKVSLDKLDADTVLHRIAERYAQARINRVDGIKIDLDEGWVHLRKSNTEPIVRIYAESTSGEAADGLARRFMEEMLSMDEPTS